MIVSEPGYSGAFTPVANSCENVSISAKALGLFAVEPIGAGTCSLQFKDESGNIGSVAVTVTVTVVGGS